MMFESLSRILRRTRRSTPSDIHIRNLWRRPMRNVMIWFSSLNIFRRTTCRSVRLLSRPPTRAAELLRQSGRFGELDGNAGRGDALQRRCVNVGAAHTVHLKAEPDNRVGIVTFRFAD